MTDVLAGKPRAIEVLHSDPARSPGGDVLVEARSGLLTAGAVAEGYGRYLRGVAHRLTEGKDAPRLPR